MNLEHLPWQSQLRLPDGRHLAFCVYGLRGGRPVYFFHGFPGSRLQAALGHEQAVEAGVSLVAFDRPGFGMTDWANAPTVDHVIADVSNLADHLGHARFGVLGVSCGGPYALASARLMPTRVTAVGLLAGMGPMNLPSLRAEQLPLLRFMFAAARNAHWVNAPLLLADRIMFRFDAMRAVEMLSKALPEPDRMLLANDSLVRRRFADSLEEAYRQGIRASLAEARRIAKQGVDQLVGIECPVHVYQGSLDRHVPVAMGEYLASNLPGGRLHFRPGEGHLSIVTRCFSECLSALAESEGSARATPAIVNTNTEEHHA
jgi:pimeloyl-ACP methyl ester carboxylesterase